MLGSVVDFLAASTPELLINHPHGKSITLHALIGSATVTPMRSNRRP